MSEFLCRQQIAVNGETKIPLQQIVDAKGNNGEMLHRS